MPGVALETVDLLFLLPLAYPNSTSRLAKTFVTRAVNEGAIPTSRIPAFSVNELSFRFIQNRTIEDNVSVQVKYSDDIITRGSDCLVFRNLGTRKSGLNPVVAPPLVLGCNMDHYQLFPASDFDACNISLP